MFKDLVKQYREKLFLNYTDFIKRKNDNNFIV